LSVQHPLPRVMLLDINLPGMSGIEAIAHLKKLLPELHIIMITVNEQDECIRRALHEGAEGYLSKSSSVQDVVSAIQSVLRGGRPMDPIAVRKLLLMFGLELQPRVSYDLSDRQKEILELLADGCTKKQIAIRLGLSYHTVNDYTRIIYDKLNVHNLSEAVGKALRERLLRK
jgi:DNA-binding NarL/FixJ family response regulator